MNKRRNKKAIQRNSNSQIPLFGNRIGSGTSVNQTVTLSKYVRSDNLTLFPFILSKLYMQEGLTRRIIQIMVDDALQGGIDINAEDEEEKEQIDTALFEFDFIEVIREAFYYARLFGGAGILIETGQSMDIPLYNSTINQYTPLKFMALSRWQIAGHNNIYLLDNQQTTQSDTHYNIQGIRVYKSRVLIINGDKAPPMISAYYGGWGHQSLISLIVLLPHIY